MPKNIKSLLPTLREKKRYLAFEVISEDKITDFSKISEEAISACNEYLGISGCAKAGIMVLDKWKNQRGLIRVSNKYVNDLIASLMLIREVDNIPVVFRSVGVSGILKKAEAKYLAS